MQFGVFKNAITFSHLSLFYLTIYYKFLQILVDIFRGRFLCVDCLSRLSFLSAAFLVVFFRIGLAKGISEFFLKIYKEFFWKKFEWVGFVQSAVLKCL